VVHNSLADWNAKYSNNPQANALGVPIDTTVYSLNGGKFNGIAPWQHDFFTWSAGHAAELGFADAKPLRDWLAKFEIGLMTDSLNNPTQGYCWLEASAYSVQVKDAAGNWLPSFAAVYAATFPTLVGLQCNSPAMVVAMGGLENKSWLAGEMHGYPYSSTGFPANFQIGVAAAADIGLPNAATAWSIFDSRSVKPSGSTSYNNDPNFAVLPRSTSQSNITSIPPPTNPIPPPATPSPSTSPQVAIQPSTTAPTPLSVTVNPVTATPDPAVKLTSTPAQVSASPVSLQPREALASRTLYLGIERGLGTALRTMRYFVGWVLPQVPPATHPAAARPVGATAQSGSGYPVLASLPKANVTASEPGLTAPNRPIDSDNYSMRGAAAADSLQIR
jgi:hypothetical protein